MNYFKSVNKGVGNAGFRQEQLHTRLMYETQKDRHSCKGHSETGGAAIDCTRGESVVVTADSEDLPVTGNAQGPLQFSHPVPPGSVHPLFLILGIEFLQKTRAGEMSAMTNDAHALAIVKAESVAAD